MLLAVLSTGSTAHLLGDSIVTALSRFDCAVQSLSVTARLYGTPVTAVSSLCHAYLVLFTWPLPVRSWQCGQG